MKIAFTTKGFEWESEMEPRFGRANFIFIYDEESKEITKIDNSEVTEFAHGAGPKTSQKLIENDVEIIITGNGPGGNASSTLQSAGIKVFGDAKDMTVKEAYDLYKENKLKAL